MVRYWRLVRTKPQSEYVAAAALSRNGYDVYFPRIQSPQPRSGHDDRPMFPGYLFLRGGEDSVGLPSIENIAGLSGWVRFDGEVPVVPDEVIAEIEWQAAKIDRGGGLWARYRPGQEVLVAAGAMEGLAVVVEEAKSPQSIVPVLLEFMGQLVPARIPWRDLRPINGDFAPGNGVQRSRRTRGKGRWIQGFGPRAVPDIQR